MNILVTGSSGFVGRNLLYNLKNIRDGKEKSRPGIRVTQIYEYNTSSSIWELEAACKKADFVFHLAGVNRAEKQSEFMYGNCKSASVLLETLKKYQNTCPVMFASSIQASLVGRFADSVYGKSKLAVEEIFFQYAADTGAKVYVYRFPNLYGKWCRPDYNSVVATFCNAVANDLDYTVHDSSTQLELLYIDDLVYEMFDVLEGKEHHCDYPKDSEHTGLEPVANPEGRYCYVPASCYATLADIVDLLKSFRAAVSERILPSAADGSLTKKLYSTYLSYLPRCAMACRLEHREDSRGVFTELLKMGAHGQVSVNITHPGITRGQHWHNSKCEIFIVVSGHGLIQERRVGIDPLTGEAYPVISFEVTGDQMQAVQMLPGYTHSITNLSETQDLVTVIWANEQFDAEHPDTFYEKVDQIEASTL